MAQTHAPGGTLAASTRRHLQQAVFSHWIQVHLGFVSAGMLCPLLRPALPAVPPPRCPFRGAWGGVLPPCGVGGGFPRGRLR